MISNKVPVGESGLLEGFRDCHCHLLPGVDDGVQEMQETMMVLEAWEEAGVSEAWLTPHIMEDYPNEPDCLRERFERLVAAYAGKVRMHLAAEHMMDGEFTDRMQAGRVMPIGKDGRRLLVETSYYIPPMNMDAVMDSIRQRGYEPVLAHPERYQYMDMGDYRRWKESGVLLQLNVPSLVGAYGPEAQWKAGRLLEDGMYDLCGTDTHSLGQAQRFIGAMISRKVAKRVKRLAEAEP